jgi:hypothetical protein
VNLSPETQTPKTTDTNTNIGQWKNPPITPKTRKHTERNAMLHELNNWQGKKHSSSLYQIQTKRQRFQ